MGKLQEGLADMEEAKREKATAEHNVIDDAIQDRGEGYTVFSIVRPISLFRGYPILICLCSPSELSIDHLKARSRTLRPKTTWGRPYVVVTQFWPIALMDGVAETCRN